MRSTRWIPTEWRKVIDVNLSGVFHTVRECLPHLVASGSGSIVCTASISGVRPAEGEAAYAAAKAGVAAFCASVALEYGPVVRCNAVSPGMIATALTAPLIEGFPDLVERMVRKDSRRRGSARRRTSPTSWCSFARTSPGSSPGRTSWSTGA